jgi:hypothetical protein
MKRNETEKKSDFSRAGKSFASHKAIVEAKTTRFGRARCRLLLGKKKNNKNCVRFINESSERAE